MILYFTGTGNSAYAARYIAEKTSDECFDLFDKIRNNDYSAVHSDRAWIIVAPVYCWQLPHLVRDWIMKTEFSGSKDVYFLLTCGNSIGNAEKYLKELSDKKKFNFKGCGFAVMPENYIAMFEAPDREKAERIINAAERALNRICEFIVMKKPLPAVKTGIVGRLTSGIVNKIYYPLIVRDKKFYAKSSCTGCGLCARKCPLGNIAIKEGKPSWNGNCTHCMACIAYCPEEAIEYGKKSVGKERYICSKQMGK